MMVMKKLKRKDLDQLNDDFSDFSLSSPARKIRRLDADLPPIIEEEEQLDVGMFNIEQLTPENLIGGGRISVEEIDSVPENQERALVLFKPVKSHLMHPSSSVSLSVDSDIISGFKNDFLRAGHSGRLRPVDDEDENEMGRESNVASSGCLAVVPWVPCQVPPAPCMELTQTEATELMEAEETFEAAMDIEENSNVSLIERGQQAHEYGGIGGGWHQQHCMIPQLPQTTSSPITWFR